MNARSRLNSLLFRLDASIPPTAFNAFSNTSVVIITPLLLHVIFHSFTGNCISLYLSHTLLLHVNSPLVLFYPFLPFFIVFCPFLPLFSLFPPFLNFVTSWRFCQAQQVLTIFILWVKLYMYGLSH